MAERLVCYFSGRVQGVGFRYASRSVAASFAVTGFVRNLRDRRVELVAEGERADLERFLSQVKSEMSGYVGETDVRWSQATGEFGSFGIRF